MQGTFIDFLPPEAQTFVGGIALLLAVAGLIVWAAGLKIARFSVAMALGLGLAGVAMVVVPRYVEVSVISSGLVGFAIGAVVGALGFRLLQGLVLAMCLSVAVGGVYYRWHVVTIAPASQPSTIAASSLLISTDRLPTTNPDVQHAVTVVQNWADKWGAIPAADQKHLEMLTIGTAGVVLLIAFAFPRATTLVVTALLGTCMFLAGAQALIHLYAEAYEHYMAWTPRIGYIVIVGAWVVGMAVQYKLFWRRKSVQQTPIPAVAVPVEST